MVWIFCLDFRCGFVCVNLDTEFDVDSMRIFLWICPLIVFGSDMFKFEKKKSTRKSTGKSTSKSTFSIHNGIPLGIHLGIPPLGWAACSGLVLNSASAPASSFDSSRMVAQWCPKLTSIRRALGNVFVLSISKCNFFRIPTYLLCISTIEVFRKSIILRRKNSRNTFARLA